MKKDEMKNAANSELIMRLCEIEALAISRGHGFKKEKKEIEDIAAELNARAIVDYDFAEDYLAAFHW